MTRNGKIARLPALVREELNVRLDEGEPGRDLVAWLNAMPKVQAILHKYFHGHGVTEQNLSEWRRGGFEDWRGQQSSIESTRTLAEHSDELQLQSNGGDLRPTRYRSYADRLAVLLSVDVFEHRQTVMQKEMDPKLRWELLKELLQQVSRLRKDDHRQARLMLDQHRCEQKEHRESEVAREVRAEKVRSQQEQSYWALLRWGPLVQMFGGGDLGKFFADAILRLQTGADPVEVPEHLKAALEAFKESLAGGGATTPAQEPESANRTECDSIRVDPTGNPVGASGPAVAGQIGQPVGPPAPSIAPNRTGSDLIRVDQTGNRAETEPASIVSPGFKVITCHLSPVRSGGEGEELHVNAVQQPKAGMPVGGNPAEAGGLAIEGQPVGPPAPPIAPNRTGSDPIQVNSTGNPVGADGQTIAGPAGQPVGPAAPSIAPNRTESNLIQVNPTESSLGKVAETGPVRSQRSEPSAPDHTICEGRITNPVEAGPRSEEEELDPSCVRPEGYGDTRDHYFFNHYRHMSWAQTEEAGKLPADHVKEYILKCLGDPMRRLEKIVKLGLGHEPTFDEPGTSWKSRQSRKRVVMSYPPGLDGEPAFAQKLWRAGPTSFKSFGVPSTRRRGNREEDLDD